MTMEEALIKAAEQFDLYAKEHLTKAIKCTSILAYDQACYKAKINENIAKMCRDAITVSTKQCTTCQWQTICCKVTPCAQEALGLKVTR